MSPLLFSVWMNIASADTDSTEVHAPPPLALPFEPGRANTPAPAPPPAAQRPLAIPRDAPVAASGLSSTERLQALRQYQRQRLSINPEIEVSGGGTSVYSGFGWGRQGFGGGMVISDPIRTSRSWGLYQGSSRLDVPSFLDVAGATDLSAQISGDIASDVKRSRTFYTVAGVGIAGLIVGSFGARTAQTELEFYQYSSIIAPSIGLTIGGMFAGSIPAARSERTRLYPSESIGLDRAQDLADAHNDRLRSSLGLSPEDVWVIESTEAKTR
jgi:hypothetical protein